MTCEPEHVTPSIEQQSIPLADDTLVVCPINFHDWTTQQQSGEDDSQLACAFTKEINEDRPNAKRDFLKEIRSIVFLNDVVSPLFSSSDALADDVLDDEMM